MSVEKHDNINLLTFKIAKYKTLLFRITVLIPVLRLLVQKLQICKCLVLSLNLKFSFFAKPHEQFRRTLFVTARFRQPLL